MKKTKQLMKQLASDILKEKLAAIWNPSQQLAKVEHGFESDVDSAVPPPTHSTAAAFGSLIPYNFSNA